MSVAKLDPRATRRVRFGAEVDRGAAFRGAPMTTWVPMTRHHALFRTVSGPAEAMYWHVAQYADQDGVVASDVTRWMMYARYTAWQRRSHVRYWRELIAAGLVVVDGDLAWLRVWDNADRGPTPDHALTILRPQDDDMRSNELKSLILRDVGLVAPCETSAPTEVQLCDSRNTVTQFVMSKNGKSLESPRARDTDNSEIKLNLVGRTETAPASHGPVDAGPGTRPRSQWAELAALASRQSKDPEPSAVAAPSAPARDQVATPQGVEVRSGAARAPSGLPEVEVDFARRDPVYGPGRRHYREALRDEQRAKVDQWMLDLRNGTVITDDDYDLAASWGMQIHGCGIDLIRQRR